jgi:predicted dehydrogenase
VECLRRGVPVLADKPICTTLEQWERIRAAAASGGGRLATMFDKRFYPETLAAKRLLADGYSVSSPCSPARRSDEVRLWPNLVVRDLEAAFG